MNFLSAKNLKIHISSFVVKKFKLLQERFIYCTNN